MRVLVLSDSHGRPRLDQWLALAEGCDLVIHLGDGFEDAQRLAALSPVPLVQVAGNHDFPFTLVPEKMISLEALEVLVTHGHMYQAKRGSDLLVRRAKHLEADVVLYGHLHRKRYEVVDGIHLFCPGSSTVNYDGSPPSVGLLEVTGRRLVPTWVELDAAGG